MCIRDRYKSTFLWDTETSPFLRMLVSWFTCKHRNVLGISDLWGYLRHALGMLSVHSWRNTSCMTYSTPCCLCFTCAELDQSLHPGHQTQQIVICRLFAIFGHHPCLHWIIQQSDQCGQLRAARFPGLFLAALPCWPYLPCCTQSRSGTTLLLPCLMLSAHITNQQSPCVLSACPL